MQTVIGSIGGLDFCKSLHDMTEPLRVYVGLFFAHWFILNGVKKS